jgi:hypothetical protein
MLDGTWMDNAFEVKEPLWSPAMWPGQTGAEGQQRSPIFPCPRVSSEEWRSAKQHFTSKPKSGVAFLGIRLCKHSDQTSDFFILERSLFS